MLKVYLKYTSDIVFSVREQNCFQKSGRGSLLNLTKASIKTKGDGSMNMNMEKGGITMNIRMTTLI